MGWGPSSPSEKRRHSTPPLFGPFIVAKRLGGSSWRGPLGTEAGLGPGHCVRRRPRPRKGHSSRPLFGPCLLWANGRPSQLLPSTCNLLHLHLAPPLGMTPFEFCRELQHQKTRVPGRVVLFLRDRPTFSRFSRTPTCNRQADRRLRHTLR